MNYLKISLGIFFALAASRFIPHPPNFTSLIALSFYVPALLGISYIPALIISFAITDFIIGYHTGTFFTWGSVFLIGLISCFFTKTLISRMSGALFGAIIFFIVTNFGVWLLGYPNTLAGFISCYTLAIPFFINTILGDLFFTHSLNYSFNKIEKKYPNLYLES